MVVMSVLRSAMELRLRKTGSSRSSALLERNRGLLKILAQPTALRSLVLPHTAASPLAHKEAVKARVAPAAQR
jgi:hypothetical protein